MQIICRKTGIGYRRCSTPKNCPILCTSWSWTTFLNIPSIFTRMFFFLFSVYHILFPVELVYIYYISKARQYSIVIQGKGYMSCLLSAVSLSIYLSIYLKIYSINYLSIYLYIYVFIYIKLSLYLFLYICMYIY